MIDWAKDPVLTNLDNRTKFAVRIAILAFGVTILAAFITVNCDDQHQQLLLRRIEALERRPTTAALADAEWREINRRLNSLESRPRSETCTRVGCLVDHGRTWTTTTPAIGSTMFLVTPGVVDTRKPGEVR